MAWPYDVCDVIGCSDAAEECHAGEIYFCIYHYYIAADRLREGTEVENAFIYKFQLAG